MSRELAALKKKLGARIRDRRSALRMSQEDLAFNADLSPTYLSQIETGKRNPSLDTIFRLSLILKIELSELLKI
jgi:transcriptional regulator with XRE-family HTH domain